MMFSSRDQDHGQCFLAFDLAGLGGLIGGRRYCFLDATIFVNEKEFTDMYDVLVPCRRASGSFCFSFLSSFSLLLLSAIL